MGSRIESFNKLQFLGALGGYDFCVSLTSFQKSNIGWPQKPPTENSSWYFMILQKNFFFQNIKLTSKLAEFMNLDDSEVFSSDFWAFRNFCSLIDLISLCNLTGLNSLYSPIFPIFFPHPDDWIIPGTKMMTNTSSFLCKEWIKIQFFNNKFRKLLLKTIF